MRRLTEAQAWETLARFFSQPLADGQRTCWKRAGLCRQTNQLVDLGLISFRVGMRMSATIHRKLARLGRRAWGGYFYRLDQDGSAKRVRYCWRQVRRLRRKKQ